MRTILIAAVLTFIIPVVTHGQGAKTVIGIQMLHKEDDPPVQVVTPENVSAFVELAVGTFKVVPRVKSRNPDRVAVTIYETSQSNDKLLATIELEPKTQYVHTGSSPDLLVRLSRLVFPKEE